MYDMEEQRLNNLRRDSCIIRFGFGSEAFVCGYMVEALWDRESIKSLFTSFGSDLP